MASNVIRKDWLVVCDHSLAGELVYFIACGLPDLFVEGLLSSGVNCFE
jgi:hypothetical protein